MAPENFFQLLGLTEKDQMLLDVINACDGSVVDVNPKRMREYGNAYVTLPGLGVDFVFVPRATYEEERGEPAGDGSHVLEGVFYFPSGGDNATYVGNAPFASKPIANRADALAVYGGPSDSNNSDGVVESEDWVKDGIQLSADYRNDGTIASFCVMLPFQG